MTALMAERRAADEAGRQETLFEALESTPAPTAGPWSPPLQAPRPHDDPHEPEAVDAVASQADDEALPGAVDASPPLAAAPDTRVAPHDDGEPPEPRADAPGAAAAADRVEAPRGAAAAADWTQAPRRAGPALAAPTLDDVMSRAWEGLVIGLPAACPVCHGEVVPSLGGPLLGRCRSCGTAID